MSSWGLTEWLIEFGMSPLTLRNKNLSFADPVIRWLTLEFIWKTISFSATGVRDLGDLLKDLFKLPTALSAKLLDSGW